MASEDLKEGLAAFVEKRPPKWTGPLAVEVTTWSAVSEEVDQAGHEPSARPRRRRHPAHGVGVVAGPASPPRREVTEEVEDDEVVVVVDPLHPAERTAGTCRRARSPPAAPARRRRPASPPARPGRRARSTTPRPALGPAGPAAADRRRRRRRRRRPRRAARSRPERNVERSRAVSPNRSKKFLVARSPGRATPSMPVAPSPAPRHDRVHHGLPHADVAGPGLDVDDEMRERRPVHHLPPVERATRAPRRRCPDDHDGGRIAQPPTQVGSNECAASHSVRHSRAPLARRLGAASATSLTSARSSGRPPAADISTGSPPAQQAILERTVRRARSASS